jgi:hypothetical protein
MGLYLLNKLLPETEITGEILRPRDVIRSHTIFIDDVTVFAHLFAFN